MICLNGNWGCFMYFKVKAGQRLLEIFRNTKSNAESPDPVIAPFSNAMHRLKTYFGSGSDVMLLRRRLALMKQKADESDLNFITRVGSMARLCEFDDEKEFEQIVGTVAEHATNQEVRKAALKMLSRRGTFTDLVDKVREIEAIRLNEEFVMQKHGKQKPALVAPVNVSYSSGRRGNMGSYQSRGGYRSRGNSSRRGNSQGPRGRQPGAGANRDVPAQDWERCWRCNSPYHPPNICGAKDKHCDFCGKLGHIRRACRSGGAYKRPAHDYSEAPSAKIAAIEKKEDDKEEDGKVSDNAED